jgi:hypothetical protein
MLFFRRGGKIMDIKIGSIIIKMDDIGKGLCNETAFKLAYFRSVAVSISFGILKRIVVVMNLIIASASKLLFHYGGC